MSSPPRNAAWRGLVLPGFFTVLGIGFNHKVLRVLLVLHNPFLALQL